MSNFGSFIYFQTFLSLGVEQGLKKLPEFDIDDPRLLFHCNTLIPRKCPRKTLFKAQCSSAPKFWQEWIGAKTFPSKKPWIHTYPQDFQIFLRLCQCCHHLDQPSITLINELNYDISFSAWRLICTLELLNIIPFGLFYTEFILHYAFTFISRSVHGSGGLKRSRTNLNALE